MAPNNVPNTNRRGNVSFGIMGKDGVKSLVKSKFVGLFSNKKSNVLNSPNSVVDIETNSNRFTAHNRKESSKQMEIRTASEDAVVEESRFHKILTIVLPWISMILAIIAASSIGPAFKYMEIHGGIGACLAASWRCQCMVIFLVPLAIAEVWWNEKNKVDWFLVKPGLTYPVIVHVIISGLAWSGNLLFWVVGLQYTTTFKASLIASSHPILLVISMRFWGTQVSYTEWGGVFLSFGGMVLSDSKEIFASGKGESFESHKYELLGYFLCFLAAAAEVVVLFNRIATKKYVPLMQYTAGTTIVVCIMATIASLALEGGNVMSSANAQHGIQVFCREEHCVFGWTSDKWATKVLLFGLWVGVVCIAGFNYAMQYIPPLIFASLGLVDPAITAILSWLIGVESLPTPLTWLGGFIVMAGVGVISIGDHHRSEKEHREEQSAHGSSDGGTDRSSNASFSAGSIGGHGTRNPIKNSGASRSQNKSSSTVVANTKYSMVESGEDSSDEEYLADEDRDEADFGQEYGDLELGVVHSKFATALASEKPKETASSIPAASSEEQEEDFSFNEKDSRLLGMLMKTAAATLSDEEPF